MRQTDIAAGIVICFTSKAQEGSLVVLASVHDSVCNYQLGRHRGTSFLPVYSVPPSPDGETPLMRASIVPGGLSTLRGPMSFSIYLVGFLIVIGGVAWGLLRAGVPTVWVIIASIIMVGIGILTGVGQTRSRDRPE